MKEPRVYLVGAGPGHPGYITLRGLECLSRAEVVIYDRLVSPQILQQAPADAELICVRDLADLHVERSPHINRLLIEKAKEGKCVVRLKGGDPLVFGRGGEEAELLHEAGISFEIVPGVTAALGAAACAGIPLTHRAYASGVAIVTGHEDPKKQESAIDWTALAKFPGTIVIYMGFGRLETIVDALIEHGKAPQTLAAAIQWATRGDQRTVQAQLKHLPEQVRNAGLQAPATILIGPVVSLRDKLSWFEARPLFGRRVLVTRPRHQASDLIRRLEELGAVCWSLPVVEIREPLDWSPVDEALSQLQEFDWLVFTSRNGVEAFFSRLRKIGLDLRALASTRIAVIGPATAEAVRRFYLEPDLIPAEFRSENLSQELREQVAGKRVLLARADRGRPLLFDQLAEVASVTQIAVYAQVDDIDIHSEAYRLVCAGEMEFVFVTSSNIARGFFGALDEAGKQAVQTGRVKIVSISPVTSATVQELGFPVAAEAKEFTTEGMIAALLDLVNAK
ncbi:MAG: uroporphyrinogen III methyltransferase [Gemmatales bacterium]|nr:MAG: uroporphyrinogen III methyltransferase [Gemmatales bacterium]